MIKSATEADLENITKYVCDLNIYKQHQCRPFNQDYTPEAIYAKFLELYQNEKDDLLVMFDSEDQIIGVLGLFIEPEEGYMQSMGGVYAHNNYSEISRQFINYITPLYKGYKTHFGFPVENISGIESMLNNGFTQIENAVIFENDDITPFTEDESCIKENKDQDINEIISFYEKHQGNVYWTIDKILMEDSRWIIRNYVVDNELVGSIYIFIYDYENAEVFGILNKGEFKKPIIKSLLSAGINECLKMDIVNILVFADNKEIVESCYEIGMIEIDTHLTFEKVL